MYKPKSAEKINLDDSFYAFTHTQPSTVRPVDICTMLHYIKTRIITA